MTENNGENRNVSLSVPVGALVVGGILVAGAAYLLFGRDGDAGGGGRSGGFRRKAGLMTLITLIENDATRRVLLTLLKAIARRG